MLKEQMEDALKVRVTNLSIIIIMMIMIIIIIMINNMAVMLMMIIVIVIILIYGPLYSVAVTFATVPFHFKKSRFFSHGHESRARVLTLLLFYRTKRWRENKNKKLMPSI